MNVKPKFVYYDIRRKQSVCLIMYTHENDVDTQVLEVSMLDNGEPIELSADYTYSAAIVNRDTQALIDDSVSCTLNESGNVLIPIDNFHTLGAQDLLIELTITDSAGNQVLVTPFPLWIHVNASILDDAQVTPESLGTVPELLEEAKEALENAGDYENLDNKPQINGHELVGNKTGANLGLNDYNDLINKPQFVGQTGEPVIDLSGTIKLPIGFSMNLTNEEIIEILLDFISGTIIADSSLNIGKFDNISRASLVRSDYINSVVNFNDAPYSSIIYITNPHQIGNMPVSQPGFLITLQSHELRSGSVHYRFKILQIYITSGFRIFTRIGINNTTSIISGGDYDSWVEVTKSISSATVNQNGTITFTMSDGSTVTTTGESVIGESAYQVAVDNGFIGTEQEWLASLKGEQGDDYVLTAQDKTDIANIVLSELPTTQGVQYGNTSN